MLWPGKLCYGRGCQAADTLLPASHYRSTGRPSALAARGSHESAVSLLNLTTWSLEAQKRISQVPQLGDCNRLVRHRTMLEPKSPAGRGLGPRWAQYDRARAIMAATPPTKAPSQPSSPSFKFKFCFRLTTARRRAEPRMMGRTLGAQRPAPGPHLQQCLRVATVPLALWHTGTATRHRLGQPPSSDM